MVSQLRLEVISETVDAYKASFFDTDADADRFPKKLVIWSSLMAAIATLIICEKNSAIADHHSVIAKP